MVSVGVDYRPVEVVMELVNGNTETGDDGLV